MTRGGGGATRTYASARVPEGPCAHLYADPMAARLAPAAICRGSNVRATVPAPLASVNRLMSFPLDLRSCDCAKR